MAGPLRVRPMVILVERPAGSGRRTLVLVEPRSGPSVVRKDGSAWLRDERLQGVAADCLAAKLRPGNVHSAEGWEEVLLPIVDRYRRCPTEGRGPGRRRVRQARDLRGAGTPRSISQISAHSDRNNGNCRRGSTVESDKNADGSRPGARFHRSPPRRRLKRRRSTAERTS